jgi:hypothetical protein
MKIATIIAQVLLGLVFVVFGSNPFLHFIPMTLPQDWGGQFLGLLIQSKYVLFVGGVQVVGGALVLANRFVPLGLTLLGPVIFNILLYHGLLSHPGESLAVIVAILWIFLFWRYRKNFVGIFAARAV